MTYFHLGAEAEPPTASNNPSFWFYGSAIDAEVWFGHHDTREECIAAARQDRGEARDEIWVARCNRMVPDIRSLVSFDGEGIVEQINKSDVWWENGWEGAGNIKLLEDMLRATVLDWFNNHCDLSGAMLDFAEGPEKIA